jgi:hypothetical protein|tara:strand:- start:6077 stop:7798 length:1722 start_codon:yes stop_codon:yes gene_type:complete
MAGPLSPVSSFGKVLEKSDIQVPKSGVLENLGAGARQGFEETTIAYLQDANLLLRAKNGVDDAIPVEEWNDTNPYYREDIKWSEDLTWNVARNIQDELAIQETANALYERATTGGKVARYAGMFGGAVLDPINIVPFTFGAAKAATWLERAARIGAANTIIEATTITPLGIAVEKARGIETTASDVLTNLGFAFGAGAGLSVLADGAVGAFRAARSMRTVTDKKIVEDMDTLKSPLDDEKVTSEINLVATKAIIGTKKINGTVDSTDSNLLKNYNINNVDQPINVKTDGTISTGNTDNGVKIFKEDKFLVVEGTSKDIVKILPTLQTRISSDKFPQIEIRFTDTLNDEIIAVERIADRVKALEQQTGVKAELDTTIVERTRVEIEDQTFDIELDNTTDKVKEIYLVKNSRRVRKLNKEEKAQAIETLSQTVELRKNTLNTELQDRSPQKIDRQIVDNRGGRQESDELLSSKEAYRTKDIITAADEGRGAVYNQTSKDIDTMITAVLSQPVFKKRHLDDLGITWNKNTGELVIRNTDEAVKDPIGRILVELKNKQQQLKKEQQALEELHICLPS